MKSANIIFWGLYFSASILLAVFCPSDFSADTLSYFQISDLYSSLKFSQALNAYWSPLLSWLMAPFRAVGMDAFLTFKLINITSGAALLYWSNGILKALACKINTEWIAMATLLFYCLEAQATSFTPDFLSAALLTGFLYTLLTQKPIHLRILSGTALIFAKSIFLPIVLLLLTGHHFFLSKESRKFLLHTGAGIILAVLVWSLLLSLKYGTLMLNSSTAYNLALSLEHNGYHYNSTAGLIAPAQKGMLFSWQDPSYYPRTPLTWKYDALKFRLTDNCFRLIYFFKYVSSWSLVLFIPMAAFLVIPVPKKKLLLFLSVCVALCLLAYFLFIPENRYFIAPEAVFILLCFYAGENLFKAIFLVYQLTVWGLLIAFLHRPYEMVENFETLKSAWKKKHESAQAIAVLLSSHPRSASNSIAGGSDIMSCASYLSGKPYYGELGYFMNTAQHEKDLKKHQIDILFLFDYKQLKNPPHYASIDSMDVGHGVYAFILNKK